MAISPPPEENESKRDEQHYPAIIMRAHPNEFNDYQYRVQNNHHR